MISPITNSLLREDVADSASNVSVSGISTPSHVQSCVSASWHRISCAECGPCRYDTHNGDLDSLPRCLEYGSAAYFHKPLILQIVLFNGQTNFSPR